LVVPEDTRCKASEEVDKAEEAVKVMEEVTAKGSHRNNFSNKLSRPPLVVIPH
jgi:hypothetical protein